MFVFASGGMPACLSPEYQDDTREAFADRFVVADSRYHGVELGEELSVKLAAAAGCGGGSVEPVKLLRTLFDVSYQSWLEHEAERGFEPTGFGPLVNAGADGWECGDPALVIAEVQTTVMTSVRRLANFNNELLCRYAFFLAEFRPIVHCPPANEFFGFAVNTGINPGEVCAVAGDAGEDVLLGPKALAGDCGLLSRVVFHEFLHDLSVPTAGTHSPGNPRDAVYACDSFVFGEDPSEEQADLCAVVQ